MITKEKLQEQLDNLQKQLQITEQNWHKIQGAIEVTQGLLEEDEMKPSNSKVTKKKEIA